MWSWQRPHVRKRQLEEQTDQALCLNLVTNAVIAWITVRYQKILKQLKDEGYPLRAGDLAHLSPARHGHVNPYGRYRFIPDPTPGSPEASPVSAI